MEQLTNKEKFRKWAAEQHVVVNERLSDIQEDPTIDYHKGQQVIFTNEFGVVFGPFEVMGIASDDHFYGRCIYLDTASYWFPVTPGQLQPVN